MPAHHDRGETGLDDLFAPFILIGVLVLMVWTIWKMEQVAILKVLLVSVWGLAQVAQYVSFLYPDRIGDNLANWAETLDSVDARVYGADTAILMMDTLAHTLVFFLLPWMLWRIIEIRKVYRVNRFIRRFDLVSLAVANRRHNPAIKAILDENLLQQPLHQGPWAMNRRPIDYVLENELLYQQGSQRLVERISNMLGGGRNGEQEEKRRYIKGWNEKKMHWSIEQRRRVMPPPLSCRLDKKRADAVMERQLGGHFRDFDDLGRFERCVAALLVTAIGDGLAPARKLALRLGNSFQRKDRKGRHRPRIDDGGITKILEKHYKNPAVKRVLERHAFKHTVMVGLLQEVTKKGIFTTNEFLWLKCVNRTLFFSLLQFGGDRPFTEAAGVFSHYQAEVLAGHGIQVPCIEAATDAIEKDLYEEEWIPNEEGELKSEHEERLSIEAAKKAQGDDPKG